MKKVVLYLLVAFTLSAQQVPAPVNAPVKPASVADTEKGYKDQIKQLTEQLALSEAKVNFLTSHYNLVQSQSRDDAMYSALSKQAGCPNLFDVSRMACIQVDTPKVSSKAEPSSVAVKK